MFLLRLLRLKATAESAEQTAFSSLHKLVERQQVAGFREFTVPRQKQGGGAIQLPGRGRSASGRNGIIPSAGGKVP